MPHHLRNQMINTAPRRISTNSLRNYNKSETGMTTSVLRQDPNTQKKVNIKTLFITPENKMKFFAVSPFSSYKTTHKQNKKSDKTDKPKAG